uniref:Uncharacterized protein n=1 Tax=Tetraselmis sp. GSL018 TaxID=582737 RepID=A0A061RVU9_9CHLO
MARTQCLAVDRTSISRNGLRTTSKHVRRGKTPAELLWKIQCSRSVNCIQLDSDNCTKTASLHNGTESAFRSKAAGFMACIAFAGGNLLSPIEVKAQLVPEPQIGDCIDCLGEVKGTLNTCSLSAPSCVSSQNDDEAHFVAPWMYDLPQDKALEQLIVVATGGPYDPMALQTPFGRSRSDVAAFILQGTFNVLAGRPPPEARPGPQLQQGYDPFDGELVDRHTTADGVEYLRFVFGRGNAEAAPEQVVDADASRVQPGPLGGTPRLSFTDSPIVWDNNYSRRLLESLRKALRFEIVPVITDFDPRFNNDRQLWFEKLLDPGNERYRPSE